MDNQRLWQHRSKEEDKEAILSLNLLERANVPKEKTLQCIYAVSNHIDGFVTMRLHMSVQKQFWSWISKIFLKILHILWCTSVFFRENTIRRQCVHC